MGLLDDLITAINPEKDVDRGEAAATQQENAEELEARALPTMPEHDRRNERIYSQAFYDKYSR